MMLFWILVGVMTLVALAFVVLPLFIAGNSRLRDRDQVNAELIREQLRELRTDLAAGRLDAPAYQAARQDLQRDFLDSQGSEPAAIRDAARSGRWAGVGLVVVMPVLALMIYQQIGAPGIVPRLDGQAAFRAQSSAAQGHNVAGSVNALAARLERESGNLEDWMLLGRSYTAMGRDRDAAAAYTRAYALAAADPDLIADYADALISANEGRFSAQVHRLLDEALALEANHLKARWLKGTGLSRRGEYRAALDHWEKVADSLPGDSEEAAIVARQIREARQRLSLNAASSANAVQPDTQAPGAPGLRIRVEVALAPALQNRVDADDTVFIHARALDGPPMPLAIARRRVRELPLTVTLTDAMGMTPEMNVSSFEEVAVQARIARSGQAMTASGDLRSARAHVSTRSDALVRLMIDEVVP